MGGEWRQPNTYRAYAPSSMFSWQLIHEVRRAMSEG
jgi:hypothetical protein